MTSAILSEQQRKLNNLATIGTVFAVNASDATMRLQIGENQTDWLPIPAICAGQVSVWRCPSIGEQFAVTCPSGDLANAIPTVALYSDQFPSPSTDENEIRVRFNDSDFLSIQTTGSQLTLKMSEIIFDGNLNVTGNVDVAGNILTAGTVHAIGDVTSNAISLQSHTHSGVKSGGSNTGSPQ